MRGQAGEGGGGERRDNCPSTFKSGGFSPTLSHLFTFFIVQMAKCHSQQTPTMGGPVKKIIYPNAFPGRQ